MEKIMMGLYKAQIVCLENLEVIEAQTSSGSDEHPPDPEQG
jgi:hypothetical protein